MCRRSVTLEVAGRSYSCWTTGANQASSTPGARWTGNMSRLVRYRKVPPLPRSPANCFQAILKDRPRAVAALGRFSFWCRLPICCVHGTTGSISPKPLSRR